MINTSPEISLLNRKSPSYVKKYKQIELENQNKKFKERLNHV